MKIKEAIATMLSDADLSIGSKVEIVAFLRRFSSKAAPVTHYSCRGSSTKALVKLLDLMGMKEKDDYTVVSSKLDDEFNQIRWSKGIRAISSLVNTLDASVNRLCGYFDALYYKVTTKQDVSGMIGKIADSEGDAVIVAGDRVDASHFSNVIKLATHKIAKYLIKELSSGRKFGIENESIAIPRALEFLRNNYSQDGTPATAAAPYVLPLPILEIYARCKCGIPGPNGLRQNVLVFKMDRSAIELFRFVRKDERVTWSGCLNAPLLRLWECPHTGRGDANPLFGYFFTSESALEGALMSNKRGLFIAGNAALIHDEGADDNITPAMCASNHRDFWDYVVRIYRVAYGLNSGLSCQCRVGVPKGMAAWNTSRLPFCFRETSTMEQEWCARFGNVMLAEYGIFLGHSVNSSYSDCYSFLNNDTPYTLRIANEAGVPDFTTDYLTKEELAWEWWAMTHLDDSICELRSGARSHTTPRRDDGEPSDWSNMRKFKDMVKTMKQADLAKLSSCKRDNNSNFYPVENPDSVFSSTDMLYSPLSAFMEGTFIAIRRAWSPDGTPLKMVKKSDGTRDDALLVTNVYSGIVTDKSPLVGCDGDDGSVFPDPAIRRGATAFDQASVETEDTSAGLTKFLDRMAVGATIEQVQFAKRSAGTLRRYVMVVETNVDCTEFMASADLNLFRKMLGTTFLQTFVTNRCDPACAFSDDDFRRSESYTRSMNHDSMMHYAGRFAGRLFPSRPNPTAYRLQSGVWDSHSATLAKELRMFVRKDSDGRMILFFVMLGEIGTYARTAYRYRCGFPMETAAMKESAVLDANSDTITATAEELKSMEAAETKVLLKHLTSRSEDYDGDRDPVPGDGDAGPLFRGVMYKVNNKRAPSRAWYEEHSNPISVASVYNG